MTALRPPPFDPADAAAAAARFAALAEPDVAYAVVDSPVGALVAAVTPQGLVRLAYEDFNGGLDEVLDSLAARLSPRILEAPARLDAVRRELEEYFAGRREAFDFPIDWTLYSDFGRRVLQATAAIPFGHTATYGQVAAQAGNAKASRAAGRALGANPIPIVVPCHRVIGTSGKLTGYTGGMHRKEALLRLEGIAF
ncbi:MAG TPA: methylated-DNA--[protein]-cysteine S-methyltransferase [Baekduia sp.]|uniref:methylated-DNA--[protein]-cysteine S-methyltransferase n=1 Tax=Baekduia sp. TaxID=2600305 RepID=UPI002B710409|nr:methylated-DNA--[protein]-cysteine S-methyltransferase [Baekduia sp.]HMJ35439.1 methylated-DNA--[protein]-cysteine S-methyltransferase [Baekduia sp.]